MKTLEFTKMQGLGNDFVVLEGPLALSSEEIQELCDRRFGVGADGVLVVSQLDPIRMEYWNADGSVAEMCGNGLRCVARYVYDKGWAADRNFPMATPVGERLVRVLDEGVEVQLGEAELTGEATIDGTVYQLVDVGNPHAVLVVADPSDVDVEGVGSRMQSNPEFKAGVNVEFIALTDTGVEMRVWERGVGETMACGTGMAAAALVATEANGVSSPVEVSVPGGVGSVDFRDGTAWLRGPADYVFTGSVAGR